MSPGLHSWLWKSRSNIFSKDIYYLWLNTCYRLDFSIDFLKIEIKELEKSEINNIPMMVDLENNISLQTIDLTWKLRSNLKVRWPKMDFLRSSTLRMLESTPWSGSIACIQPEIRKVIAKMCITLSSKVERFRYVNYFNIFEIQASEC